MDNRLCPAPQQWFSSDGIDQVSLVCFGGIQYLVTRAVVLQSIKYSKH
jgi:hypothetical protein